MLRRATQPPHIAGPLPASLKKTNNTILNDEKDFKRDLLKLINYIVILFYIRKIMNTMVENKFKLLIISIFFFHSCVISSQSDRETWQPPEQIMDSVGVKPGMIIGEVGAGRGYFTFPLAKRVGEKGKVYANDISTSSLDEIKARLTRENIKNIIPVLGETEDPLFPQKNHDMIIMVYVLHMLEKPVELMENLKKYMTPETQLVIIERNSDTDRAHYPSFMSKKQVLEMIDKSNYKLVRIMTFLSRDNIYIYKTKN
jgi:ubiquinone/menaquinone biosynthesis C-methylase UbiE